MERKSFKVDSMYGPSIVINSLSELNKGELSKIGIYALCYNSPRPRELSMDEALYLFHEAGAVIILENTRRSRHSKRKLYLSIVEGPKGAGNKAKSTLNDLLKEKGLGEIV